MFNKYIWNNATLKDKAQKFSYGFLACMVVAVIFSFIFGGVLKYAIVFPLFIGGYFFYCYYRIQSQDKLLRKPQQVAKQ